MHDNATLPATLGERKMPFPDAMSDGARRYLRDVSVDSNGELTDYPALTDHAAWTAYIADVDARIAGAPAPAFADTITQDWSTRAGIAVLDAKPIAETAVDDAIVLHLHGGGLIVGGGSALPAMSLQSTYLTQCRTVAPDYRMPPNHPFPAALDDCELVYLDLVEEFGAQRVVVHGISAGGNLAIALTNRIIAKDLPIPACVLAMTPEVDLTESGDTFESFAGLDPLVPGSLRPQSELYAAGRPLDDPEISPLFADFSESFPPTWIQSGTRDRFLSNAVLLHRVFRRRGVTAELHIWDGMPHGGFGGDTDEDAEMGTEMQKFIAKYVLNR